MTIYEPDFPLVQGSYPFVFTIGGYWSNNGYHIRGAEGLVPEKEPWTEKECWLDPDWNLWKPDFIAPGEEFVDYPVWLIRSTHLAATLFAGCVLLLQDAFPGISGKAIFSALVKTSPGYATLCGNCAPYNCCGHGKVNFYDAYLYIKKKR